MKARCEEWLIEVFMASTERYATEMYSEGEAQGFSESLMRQVKIALGIGNRKDGLRSLWVSPYTPENRDSSDSSGKKYNKSSTVITVTGVGDNQKKEGTVTLLQVSELSDRKRISDSSGDSSNDRGLNDFNPNISDIIKEKPVDIQIIDTDESPFR